LILGIVETALTLYGLAILARALLGWATLRSGTLSYGVYRVLYDVTEPYLRVFRSFLPHVRLGNAALDLSPVAGLVVLFIVQRLIAMF
jgi:YggT family protein